MSRGWVAAVALVAAVGAGVWFFLAAPPPLPDLSFADGDEELRASLTKYADAVRANPQQARAWGELGMILRGIDRKAEARPCFGVAARLEPDAARWHYLLGESHLPGEPAESRRHLERANLLGVRRGEPNATVQLRLVEALLLEGDHAAAAGVLADLRRRRGGDAVVMLYSGLAAKQAGDVAGAAGYFRKCLDDPRTMRRAAASLADVPGENVPRTPPGEDAPWADEFLSECLRPAVGVAVRLRQTAQLEAAGRHAEAVALLREVRKTSEDYRVRVALGKNLARAGYGDDAVRELVAATRAEPKRAQGFGILAGVYLAQKKYSAAADAATAALKLHPQDANALLVRGLSQAGLGDDAAAEADYAEALRVSPDFGEAHLLLGLSLLKRGEPEKASPHLREAQRRAKPGDDRAANALKAITRRT